MRAFQSSKNALQKAVAGEVRSLSDRTRWTICQRLGSGVKERILPLEHVVGVTYGTPPGPEISRAIGLNVLRSRTLLFGLVTRARTYYFISQSDFECRCWVLTLGRLLGPCAGGMARVKTPRGYVLARMRARVDIFATETGVSRGEIWMQALRRTASERDLNFNLRAGRDGVRMLPASQR